MGPEVADHRVAAQSRDPLLAAWLLGIAAVAPLFCAVLVVTAIFSPTGDTHPAYLASFALAFLGAGAIVTTFAGGLLARSALFRWADRHPPAIPALIVLALALVVPAVAEMGQHDDPEMGLILLAATELSIALTWLAAVRIHYAAIATFLMAAAIVVGAM